MPNTGISFSDILLLFGIDPVPASRVNKKKKPAAWLTTTGVDGLLEPVEKRPDFSMTDEEFKSLAKWYLAFSEKRDLLGSTNHLLYICRKQA